MHVEWTLIPRKYRHEHTYRGHAAFLHFMLRTGRENDSAVLFIGTAWHPTYQGWEWFCSFDSEADARAYAEDVAERALHLHAILPPRLK